MIDATMPIDELVEERCDTKVIHDHGMPVLSFAHGLDLVEPLETYGGDYLRLQIGQHCVIGDQMLFKATHLDAGQYLVTINVYPRPGYTK